MSGGDKCQEETMAGTQRRVCRGSTRLSRGSKKPHWLGKPELALKQARGAPGNAWLEGPAGENSRGMRNEERVISKRGWPGEAGMAGYGWTWRPQEGFWIWFWVQEWPSKGHCLLSEGRVKGQGSRTEAGRAVGGRGGNLPPTAPRPHTCAQQGQWAPDPTTGAPQTPVPARRRSPRQAMTPSCNKIERKTSRVSQRWVNPRQVSVTWGSRSGQPGRDAAVLGPSALWITPNGADSVMS